jgi:hypothetical protein
MLCSSTAPAASTGGCVAAATGGRSLLTHDPAHDPGFTQIVKLALLRSGTPGVSRGVIRGVTRVRAW